MKLSESNYCDMLKTSKLKVELPKKSLELIIFSKITKNKMSIMQTIFNNLNLTDNLI
jgi:hypothetical protein